MSEVLAQLASATLQKSYKNVGDLLVEPIKKLSGPQILSAWNSREIILNHTHLAYYIAYCVQQSPDKPLPGPDGNIFSINEFIDSLFSLQCTVNGKTSPIIISSPYAIYDAYRKFPEFANLFNENLQIQLSELKKSYSEQQQLVAKLQGELDALRSKPCELCAIGNIPVRTNRQSDRVQRLHTTPSKNHPNQPNNPNRRQSTIAPSEASDLKLEERDTDNQIPSTDDKIIVTVNISEDESNDFSLSKNYPITQSKTLKEIIPSTKQKKKLREMTEHEWTIFVKSVSSVMSPWLCRLPRGFIPTKTVHGLIVRGIRSGFYDAILEAMGGKLLNLTESSPFPPTIDTYLSVKLPQTCGCSLTQCSSDLFSSASPASPLTNHFLTSIKNCTCIHYPMENPMYSELATLATIPYPSANTNTTPIPIPIVHEELIFTNKDILDAPTPADGSQIGGFEVLVDQFAHNLPGTEFYPVFSPGTPVQVAMPSRMDSQRVVWVNGTIINPAFKKPHFDLPVSNSANLSRSGNSHSSNKASSSQNSKNLNNKLQQNKIEKLIIESNKITIEVLTPKRRILSLSIEQFQPGAVPLRRPDVHAFRLHPQQVKVREFAEDDDSNPVFHPGSCVTIKNEFSVDGLSHSEFIDVVVLNTAEAFAQSNKVNSSLAHSILSGSVNTAASRSSLSMQKNVQSRHRSVEKNKCNEHAIPRATYYKNLLRSRSSPSSELVVEALDLPPGRPFKIKARCIVSELSYRLLPLPRAALSLIYPAQGINPQPNIGVKLLSACLQKNKGDNGIPPPQLPFPLFSVWATVVRGCYLTDARLDILMQERELIHSKRSCEQEPGFGEVLERVDSEEGSILRSTCFICRSRRSPSISTSSNEHLQGGDDGADNEEMILCDAPGCSNGVHRACANLYNEKKLFEKKKNDQQSTTECKIPANPEEFWWCMVCISAVEKQKKSILSLQRVNKSKQNSKGSRTDLRLPRRPISSAIANLNEDTDILKFNPKIADDLTPQVWVLVYFPSWADATRSRGVLGVLRSFHRAYHNSDVLRVVGQRQEDVRSMVSLLDEHAPDVLKQKCEFEGDLLSGSYNDNKLQSLLVLNVSENEVLASEATFESEMLETRRILTHAPVFIPSQEEIQAALKPKQCPSEAVNNDQSKDLTKDLNTLSMSLKKKRNVDLDSVTDHNKNNNANNNDNNVVQSRNLQSNSKDIEIPYKRVSIHEEGADDGSSIASDFGDEIDKVHDGHETKQKQVVNRAIKRRARSNSNSTAQEDEDAEEVPPSKRLKSFDMKDNMASDSAPGRNPLSTDLTILNSLNPDLIHQLALTVSRVLKSNKRRRSKSHRKSRRRRRSRDVSSSSFSSSSSSPYSSSSSNSSFNSTDENEQLQIEKNSKSKLKKSNDADNNDPHSLGSNLNMDGYKLNGTNKPKRSDHRKVKNSDDSSRRQRQQRRASRRYESISSSSSEALSDISNNKDRYEIVNDPKLTLDTVTTNKDVNDPLHLDETESKFPENTNSINCANAISEGREKDIIQASPALDSLCGPPHINGVDNLAL